MSFNSIRLLPYFSGLALSLACAPYALAADLAPINDGASQVAITLTADNGGACLLDYNHAKAGPITFHVTNKTATAISEVELLSDQRILGEKENLAPGLPSVNFTVTLGGGDYQIYCPGAKQQLQTFSVSGKAIKASGDIADLLNTGAAGYSRYVDGMVDALVTAVTRLKQDIDAGNIEKARAQYPQSRIFYERIESDIEGFVLPGYKITNNAGSLDYLIDMRASSLDPKVGWHGFHAIERDLFKFNKIDDGTRAYAAELLKNVQRLSKVAKGLEFRPEDLANGAAGLLEEVLGSKVSGEEESFSHTDLVDFAGNVEGARQAFAFLKPGLEKIDANLTEKVSERFQAVAALLKKYQDPDEIGGYVRYTAALKESDGATLSRAIQTLQEPLSRIAAKVATAGL